MISNFSLSIIRLFGLLLTVVGSAVAAGFLGNISRGVFCHYQSQADYAFSKVWCHYFDWDFRVDQALFLLGGAIFGATLFLCYFKKKQPAAMYFGIAILWAFTILFVVVRLLLRQLGIDYSN